MHTESILTLEDCEERRPSLRLIQDIVCDVCEVSREDLLKVCRFQRIARARLIYYHVARYWSGKSLAQIGWHCGQRDHSTVFSGLETVAKNPGAFEPHLGWTMHRVIRSVEMGNNSQLPVMTSAAA